MVESLHPETLALHAGWRADPTTGAVAPPIFQTTSYQFKDADHAANLFALSEPGFIYTRIMNPTQDVLEQRLAALEGGAAALLTSSGQSASAFSIQVLTKPGDNVVAGTDLYGGTYNLFHNTLKDFGVEVRFVDPTDPEAFAKATDDKTRAYYIETLPNPKLIIPDIKAIADVGRPLGIPLIVDNTASPLIAKPLKHGAAVVVYSTTKYIGGHGTSIGGAIIDSGTFDWKAHPKRQPNLHQKEGSYHGAVFAEIGGPIAYILRIRTILTRDLGSNQSPFNAFQTIQGVETLPLRIARHVENTNKVVDFLKTRKEIVKVIHPSLLTGKQLEIAKEVLEGGFGGLVGFELEGGKEAGKKFINNLKLFYHVANIGDARSLAIAPASTTHSQLSEEEQLATGVTPGYVRLSVGLEHIDDILADLTQALNAAI